MPKPAKAHHSATRSRDQPDEPRLNAALLDDDGRHVTLGLADGSIRRVDLIAFGIPIDPPLDLVEPDEVGAGLYLLRRDGTVEDCSLALLLEGPRPRIRAGGDLAGRVAEHLRQLRAERVWTQREAARRLGMAASNYARLEVGRHVPSTQTLVKLAECFAVPLADLAALSTKRPR